MDEFDALFADLPDENAPQQPVDLGKAKQLVGTSGASTPIVPGAPESAPQDGMSLRDIPIVGGMADAAFQATQAVEQIPGALQSASEVAGSVGQSGIVHHVNTKLAAKQGTQPHVLDPNGGYLRENLGPVIAQGDGGQYFFGDGERLVNGRDHVILLDPTTGDPTVFRRDPNWDESGYAGAGRMMIEGMLTGPPGNVMPSASGVASRGAVVSTGEAAARSADDIGALSAPVVPPATRGPQRAADAARDLEAFEEANIPPIGAAFHGPIGRGVAKQVSETAFIGGPMQKSLERGVHGAKNYADEVANEIGPAALHDQVGHTLQEGLRRYQFGGVKDLPADDLKALGITHELKAQPADVMSTKAAKRMRDTTADWEVAGDVAQTNRGVPVPAAKTINQTLFSRPTAADLSDKELGIIINAPSRSTSFGARMEALYERAWRLIPNLKKETTGAEDPLSVAAKNTRIALNEVDSNIASSIVSQNKLTGDLAERIRNPQAGNFPIHDLRAIRTEVGRALSNFGEMEVALDRSQLKVLYGALSRDIEIGLIDIANRAMKATKLPTDSERYLPMSEALKAGGALRAFRTADRYTRASLKRMDQFIKIIGVGNPEQAAKRMVSAAMEGGKGNMRLYDTARAALRPEEWGQFSALILREMGKPLPSARGIVQEVGFSPATFITNWNKLDQRARNTLFGAEHARAVENLFRVTNRLANVDDMVNTSRSATNAINIMASLGTLTSLARFDFTTPLVAGGAGGALSILLSRPSYARWLTGYMRLRAKAIEAPKNVRVAPRMITHVNRLEQMARQNPEMLSIYQAVAAENGIVEAGNGDQVNKDQPGLPVGNTEDNQEF
jgi:hypothetical protein